MADNRVYDGFSTLPGGMNGALSPSLIGIDQVSASSNLTFRDGYVKARPGFKNILWTFADDTTETNWAGKFQGAVGYEAEFGEDGFVIAKNGRLFRFQFGLVNFITEITPKITIITTAQFTVPALNSNVTVSINSETAIPNGATIFMDSGQYLVEVLLADQIVVKYQGSAANATVAVGTPLLDGSNNVFYEYALNDPTLDMIFMFQAENYVIVCAGQNKTQIYDGSNSRLAAQNEIPPCLYGIYIWGRIWAFLNDKATFVAGDIVFGPSGTAQNGYRDAILKFTENTFLNEGGSFGVPKNAGNITAPFALATQDTSLGIGNLLVGTTNSVVSVNTPTDRTTWKNLTYPIQTLSLIDYGTQGPRWTVSIDGDEWFRSLDGIRSFVVARRAMGSPGNVPVSREVSPILDFDTVDLLLFGSGMLFDNRLLGTVSPYRDATGVLHQGLVICNYDLISSLRNKSSPSWEGAWSGLNAYQVLKTTVKNTERAFAWALGNTGDAELWEITKNGYYDEYLVDNGSGNRTNTRTRISSWLETRSMPFSNSTILKRLYTAELYLDQLVDNVSITIKFRPDQSPTWVTWTTINLCATVTQCGVPSNPDRTQCQVWMTDAPLYAARIMLPQAPESCNAVPNTTVNNGYEFQFRIEGTGHYRIRQFKIHAIPQSDTSVGACPSEAVCKTVPDCGTQWFGTYDSHG